MHAPLSPRLTLAAILALTAALAPMGPGEGARVPAEPSRPADRTSRVTTREQERRLRQRARQEQR